MSTWMQRMTYQPIHSVAPLVCISYKRAADGSAGSDTERQVITDFKIPAVK